jgi:hypothetical protein
MSGGSCGIVCDRAERAAGMVRDVGVDILAGFSVWVLARFPRGLSRPSEVSCSWRSLCGVAAYSSVVGGRFGTQAAAAAAAAVMGQCVMRHSAKDILGGSRSSRWSSRWRASGGLFAPMRPDLLRPAGQERGDRAAVHTTASPGLRSSQNTAPPSTAAIISRPIVCRSSRLQWVFREEAC